MTDHPRMEHTGYGLIETMRVRGGRIPFLERHLARLERSLRELGLPKPSQDVAALVRPFAGIGEAVLRVDVCDGRAMVTVRDLPALDPPVVITASEPHQPYPHKTTDRDAFADAAVKAGARKRTTRCSSPTRDGSPRGLCGPCSGGTGMWCARPRSTSGSCPASVGRGCSSSRGGWGARGARGARRGATRARRSRGRVCF